MKPRTREENFLAKIAGDASADSSMQPRTPEEYFLNEISGTPKLPASAAADSGKVLTVNESGEASWAEASGGGSSLPSYTSTDKGKVLMVGEDFEHTSSVIAIPQQSVTVSGGQATFANPVLSAFGEGYSFTMTVNGTEYTGEIVISYGQLNASVENEGYYIVNGGDVAYFYADDGDYTVKLEIAVPDTAPVWDNVEIDELVLYFTSGSNIPKIKGGETYSYDEFFAAVSSAIENKLPIRVFNGGTMKPFTISINADTLALTITLWDGLQNELYSCTSGGQWVHYTNVLLPSTSGLANGTYQLTKSGSTLTWTAVT